MNQPLQGKCVAVLVEQQYQEMEVWYPVYRLREAGARVVLVGPEAGVTYPSKLGYPAKSEVAAKDVKADTFDAVVVPGGFAPDFLAPLRTDDPPGQRPGRTGQGHRRHLPRAVGAVFDESAPRQEGDLLLRHQGRCEQRRRPLPGRRSGCATANLITSRKPDDLPAFLQTIIQAVREQKVAPAAAR